MRYGVRGQSLASGRSLGLSRAGGEGQTRRGGEDVGVRVLPVRIGARQRCLFACHVGVRADSMQVGVEGCVIRGLSCLTQGDGRGVSRQAGPEVAISADDLLYSRITRLREPVARRGDFRACRSNTV